MLQIKTIADRLDNAKDFDDKVNKALENGWIITKRYLSEPKNGGDGMYYRMLIAELIKREKHG